MPNARTTVEMLVAPTARPSEDGRSVCRGVDLDGAPRAGGVGVDGGVRPVEDLVGGVALAAQGLAQWGVDDAVGEVAALGQRLAQRAEGRLDGVEGRVDPRPVEGGGRLDDGGVGEVPQVLGARLGVARQAGNDSAHVGWSPVSSGASGRSRPRGGRGPRLVRRAVMGAVSASGPS